jgi:site-specific DNA recombinase
MQLEELKTRKNTQQRKITALIDSLIDAEDGVTRSHINQRIKEYDHEIKQTEEQIKELEDLLARDVMNEDGIFILAQLLKSLSTTIDDLSIEEKRAAIRTVVRKIIWDGENIHVILFGDPDGDNRKPIINLDDINVLENFDIGLNSDFTLSSVDSK